MLAYLSFLSSIATDCEAGCELLPMADLDLVPPVISSNDLAHTTHQNAMRGILWRGRSPILPDPAAVRRRGCDRDLRNSDLLNICTWPGGIRVHDSLGDFLTRAGLGDSGALG